MAVKRRIIGVIIVVARVLGWLFIALAILGLPQMRFLTGNLAGSLGLLSSIAWCLQVSRG
jgi:hypothetical protein